MKTTKEKRQQESIDQVAADYRSYMMQIKELEKKVAPAKKLLTDFAKTSNVPSLSVGGLTIEQRVTPKATISQDQVTTDWLDNMTDAGFGGLVTINVDYKGVQAQLPNDELEELLAEVDFEEKETITYAIRL